MLQPLVLGWCSLAASGLLPRLSSARAALQQVLLAFDTTTVTSSMLWTLLNSCCWDVAAALASHATNVDESAAMAANAAAGRWPRVVRALLAEHERSVYYPRCGLLPPLLLPLPAHSFPVLAIAAPLGCFDSAKYPSLHLPHLLTLAPTWYLPRPPGPRPTAPRCTASSSPARPAR